MNTPRMKIIFDGESNQIDVNTLIVALGHYQAIAEVVNLELGEGKKIDIKINAIEKGSFIIDISVVESIFKTLFSKDSIGYASDVIAIIATLYGIYHGFKGKRIKSADEINYININISKNISIRQTIVNIYNQTNVRSAISKTIEAAEKDTNVDGFRIRDEFSESEVYIPRNEFLDLIKSDLEQDENIQQITERKRVQLSIVSMSFESGNSWQFIYDGFKISVRVRDNALMALIDNGERFGKGDTIEVELEIIKKFNPDFGTYENKSYKILEFYKHIPIPTTKTLFE